MPAAFLAALTRYRLWDVEILTRETVALLGAAFLGAGLFSLAQVADLGDVLPGIPYGRGLVEAGAGLLIALTFFPVRRGLSTALARVQYGERFGEREGLLALVRELSRPRRLAEIGPLLAERVMSGLGVPRATLLLALPDGRLDASTLDAGEPLSLQELPSEATTKTTRLSRLAFNERPTVAVARTRRAGFRTIAPLALSGRLLGLFAVADRGGRDPLSGEDVELLETVLASAALAVDHARLYGELEAQAEQYRRLKEFHEDVVTGSPAAIVVTDERGRISSVNPAFEKLFGDGEGSLAGRLADDVLPQAILSARAPARVEVTLGHESRVLDVAVSPFPGAPEGSPARVWVLSDSTELARLEKSLAERDRLSALSNLSAGVAHEVNTPLTGVASFARLLLDETAADDPRRPLLEKIERQAFRAARLVGSLLDLARGRPREMASLEPADPRPGDLPGPRGRGEGTARDARRRPAGVAAPRPRARRRPRPGPREPPEERPRRRLPPEGRTQRPGLREDRRHGGRRKRPLHRRRRRPGPHPRGAGEDLRPVPHDEGALRAAWGWAWRSRGISSARTEAHSRSIPPRGRAPGSR